MVRWGTPNYVIPNCPSKHTYAVSLGGIVKEPLFFSLSRVDTFSLLQYEEFSQNSNWSLTGPPLLHASKKVTVFGEHADGSRCLFPAPEEAWHQSRGLSLEVFVPSPLRRSTGEKYQEPGVALQCLDSFQITNFNFFIKFYGLFLWKRSVFSRNSQQFRQLLHRALFKSGAR